MNNFDVKVTRFMSYFVLTLGYFMHAVMLLSVSTLATVNDKQKYLGSVGLFTRDY